MGMTDVSAHGDRAETAEAKKIINREHMLDNEGVKGPPQTEGEPKGPCTCTRGCCIRQAPLYGVVPAR